MFGTKQRQMVTLEGNSLDVKPQASFLWFTIYLLIYPFQSPAVKHLMGH